MCKPLTSTTEVTRVGMLAISLRSTATGILRHSSCKAAIKLEADVGRDLLFLICRSNDSKGSQWDSSPDSVLAMPCGGCRASVATTWDMRQPRTNYLLGI